MEREKLFWRRAQKTRGGERKKGEMSADDADDPGASPRFVLPGMASIFEKEALARSPSSRAFKKPGKSTRASSSID